MLEFAKVQVLEVTGQKVEDHQHIRQDHAHVGLDHPVELAEVAEKDVQDTREHQAADGQDYDAANEVDVGELDEDILRALLHRWVIVHHCTPTTGASA